MEYIGILLAFLTSVSWAVSSVIFEIATKKTDTVSINVIRLMGGIVLLGCITIVTKGMFLPLDSNITNWTYLGTSGVIGLFLGDIFLYQAFYVLGARRCMLFLTLTPLIVGLFGFLFLGETLTLSQLVAMLITCSGILMVVVKPKEKTEENHSYKKISVKGVALVCAGVFFEAIGNVFTKVGAHNYDAVASTQIRMICALVVFFVFLTVKGKWGNLKRAAHDKKNLFLILTGATVATMGITCLIAAFNRLNIGIASTIGSISPVVIIPISIFVFKEKVTIREILGAIVSVLGIAIFFLN